MAMGVFLRELRESRGLSQRQLASLLDIDPTYLCHLEKGRKRFLGRKMLGKLVAHLDLTEEEEQMLQAQREIAVGKLPVPTGITSEAANVLKALAGATCEMTDRELGLTKLIVALLTKPALEKQMPDSKAT